VSAPQASGAPPFPWRQVALPAFGPSLIGSIGTGAVAPILALAARDLGASVALAAFFVALPLLAELLLALPVGALIDRLGERVALTLGALLAAGAGLLGWYAASLWSLAAAVVLLGPSGVVLVVARQSWLGQVAPPSQRARAMSTLGGVVRIGWFLGPLGAAPLIAIVGPRGSFLVLGAAGLLAAALTWWSMDLDHLELDGLESLPRSHPGSGRRSRLRGGALRHTWAAHRHTFLTVGLGVLVIGLARTARTAVVPLWAQHIGMSASDVALLFSLTFGLEMLLFFPAGWIMDRFGRVWVAVPVAVGLGGALLALPLATTPAWVVVATLVMGLSNGMGSGVVMTLGADLAPENGRGAFLGIWRWLNLIGTNGAALLVSAVTAFAGLASAAVLVGALAVAGGGWLARWVPRHTSAGESRS